MNEIASRLRSACTGHPCATIPWPHRLLHEAADEIERLEKELARRGLAHIPADQLT